MTTHHDHRRNAIVLRRSVAALDVRPDLEVSSEPPLVQDDTALARIQPDPVPYPLMRAPRADVGVGALAWYLCRLVWWRIRSRGWRRGGL